MAQITPQPNNDYEEQLKERLKSAKICSWREEITYSGGRIHVEYWLPPKPVKVAEIPRLAIKSDPKSLDFDLF